MSKFTRIVLIISFLAILLNASAHGQAVVGEFVPDIGLDLSGNWNPVLHEDFLERIPGPELVNYSGLPISVRNKRSHSLQFSGGWPAGRSSLRKITALLVPPR